ncbi:MAG TPA: protein-glutamate O-methyltransferase CheR [Edaphobacter sp.]|nr:protein-glutamate O-methyltransferase CheR [Edaphobacter sp.]
MACSDADYAYLREVVLEQSANRIDPSRNALFDARLTPIARQTGAANLKDFVKLLKVDRTENLHRMVAEAMTINETSFFRDLKPFEMLRETIIPRLIELRRDTRRLRIWSAASSTGQEAYSVAMLIAEHFPLVASWDIKIVGTDISRFVIDQAQQGRYRRLEVNRGLPARMLLKYFSRDGEEWEISARIRSMCEFQYANLCGPLTGLPLFDLVLLRNVLLYFPPQDRSSLFQTVYRQMAADGCLMLGNAEQAEGSTDLFEVEFASGSYCYHPNANI